jgi:REP element-mobilizing transposase RayT
VHVTTRLLPGLPSLRRTEELRVLLRAIRLAQERSGMRIVHYSIQTNHLHLLVEAQGRESLALGIQGLLVRVAHALNRLWQRTGRLFADRYHAHVLRTPAEVRHALVYVLQNARKHGLPLTGVDAYSSGAWFEGWEESATGAARREEIVRRLERLMRERTVLSRTARGVRVIQDAPGTARIPGESPRSRVQARTWLLRTGWIRHGRIRIGELPRSGNRR